MKKAILLSTIVIVFFSITALGQHRRSVTASKEKLTGNRKPKKLEPYRGRFGKELAQLIVKSANAEGIDFFLILEVMRHESCFNPFARSPVGARGLMQFMPATAARYGVSNPYDPEQAIPGACRYLADLLRMFDGQVHLALAGYNAGENAVIKYGYKVPPYRETQNYVRSIMAAYKRALAIAQHKGSYTQTRPLSNDDVKRRLAAMDRLLWKPSSSVY